MSVVIVKRPQGYVAHLRFEDSTKDCDISSTSHYMIYYLIEKHVGNQKD